jgi:hypothetical protein
MLLPQGSGMPVLPLEPELPALVPVSEPLPVEPDPVEPVLPPVELLLVLESVVAPVVVPVSSPVDEPVLEVVG